MPEPKVAREWNCDSVLKTPLRAETQSKQAQTDQPQRGDVLRRQKTAVNLFPTGPQFARGRRRNFRLADAAIHRRLRMQGKEEEQGAEHYGQRSPQYLASFRSGIQKRHQLGIIRS